MFQQFDEAAAHVRQHGITMVDLKFCDLAGRWRHVTLPAERFTPELMEDGVGFDGSSVGLRSVKSGDLVLVPDLTTAFLDPFPEEKTLSFLCRILEADDRSPVLFDPRTIARRAEERLRASGVGTRSLWGPEFEFYLFDGVAYENGVNVASYRVESSEADWRSHELGSGFTIPRHGGYHALPPQDHLDDARTKISRILESVGVPVKYHHHEVGGPGQCEIEIPLRGLLDACDAVLMVKYVVRRAARKMGLTATFMPKPLYGEAGSGMHCHQLVLDGERNVVLRPRGLRLRERDGALRDRRPPPPWRGRHGVHEPVDELLPPPRPGLRGAGDGDLLARKPQRGDPHPEVREPPRERALRVPAAGRHVQPVPRDGRAAPRRARRHREEDGSDSARVRTVRRRRRGAGRRR